MLLFLVGMMGSGKSTLGRQLALNLQVPFVDMDNYLERREHRSIAQLFEQEGPVHFRELERQALEAAVAEYKQAVIATGGGAPCFHNNMGFMNKSGTSIFLDVSENEILKRLLASDLQVRPLLANKSEEELKKFISHTLSERKPFYLQAKYRLQEQPYTVQALLALLNKKA